MATVLIEPHVLSDSELEEMLVVLRAVESRMRAEVSRARVSDPPASRARIIRLRQKTVDIYENILALEEEETFRIADKLGM